MSKLVWDADSTRLYETGVRQGVLYLRDGDGAYSKGVAWNGLTGVTESPSGAEATDLYADDIKYLSLLSAETFGATIEAYMYPVEFAECDGSAQLTPGAYIGQQTRNTFGFAYRTVVGNDVQGENYGYKLHLIYGCKASPSEKAYQTINESPDAITFSWEVNTTPVNVEIDGKTFKPTATVTINSFDFAKEAGAGKGKLEYFKKLEEVLYGTADKDARLPLPGEVYKILTTGEENSVG